MAVAGVAAGALILALPRLAASRRALRFRLGRWLSPRTTSLRAASQAWGIVSAWWLVRAVALFLLLGALGIGYPLRWRGSGGVADRSRVRRHAGRAASLIASGVGASKALAVAVSVGALGVISGTAILLFAVAWRTSRSLVRTRAA